MIQLSAATNPVAALRGREYDTEAPVVAEASCEYPQRVSPFNDRSSAVLTTACENWKSLSQSSWLFTINSPSLLYGPRLPIPSSAASVALPPALWLSMLQTICKKSLTQETRCATPSALPMASISVPFRFC